MRLIRTILFLAVVTLTPSLQAASLGFGADLSYSSNFYQTSDPEYASNVTLLLNPRYRYDKNISFNIKTYVTKEFNDFQDADVSNTYLTMQHRFFNLAPRIHWINAGTLTLPTQKAAREKETLQAATGLNSKLLFDQSKNKTLPFNITLGLSYRKNFHQYETQTNGVNNVSAIYGPSFGSTVFFSRDLYLSLSAQYSVAVTYEGFERNLFDVSSYLNYQINSNFSVNTGISNAGQVLKENGVDSNVKLFDQQSSQFSVGVGYDI